MVAAGPNPARRRRARAVHIFPVGRAAGEGRAVVNPVGDVPGAPRLFRKGRREGLAQFVGAGHFEHRVGGHLQRHRIALDLLDGRVLRGNPRALLRLGRRLRFRRRFRFGRAVRRGSARSVVRCGCTALVVICTAGGEKHRRAKQQAGQQQRNYFFHRSFPVPLCSVFLIILHLCVFCNTF